jgi:hypothetical protein
LVINELTKYESKGYYSNDEDRCWVFERANVKREIAMGRGLME